MTDVDDIEPTPLERLAELVEFMCEAGEAGDLVYTNPRVSTARPRPLGVTGLRQALADLPDPDDRCSSCERWAGHPHAEWCSTRHDSTIFPPKTTPPITHFAAQPREQDA